MNFADYRSVEIVREMTVEWDIELLHYYFMLTIEPS